MFRPFSVLSNAGLINRNNPKNGYNLYWWFKILGQTKNRKMTAFKVQVN